MNSSIPGFGKIFSLFSDRTAYEKLFEIKGGLTCVVPCIEPMAKLRLIDAFRIVFNFFNNMCNIDYYSMIN